MDSSDVFAYLVSDAFLSQWIAGRAVATDANKMDKAAPTIPYAGTKNTKDNKNTETNIDPIVTISLGLSILLNLEMALTTIV